MINHAHIFDVAAIESQVKKCRVFSSEPGRVGPEMPGRHAPALTFHATIFLQDSIYPVLNALMA